MKIVIDKVTKRTILKWLQKGVIDTEELPVLNELRNNWFEALLREAEDEEKPSFTRADIERIEKLSQAVITLTFPTREDMLKELERLETMEKGGNNGNM